MSLILVTSCVLFFAKIVVIVSGQELLVLDTLSALFGVAMVGFGILEFLFSGGSRKSANTISYVLLLTLGLVAFGLSTMSGSTANEPYLLIKGTKEIRKGFLFRFPGKEVLHYSENPIEGEFPFETRILREDQGSDGKWRPILIKAHTTISYSLGLDEPRKQFPEMWEFNDIIRDALASAQWKIPAGEDFDAYQGEELRNLFQDYFSTINSKNGYIVSSFGYELAMKIDNVSAEPIENYPADDRWFHASFPIYYVSKECK